MKKLMAAMLSFVMAMMLLAGCASASTDNTFSDPMQQVSLSNDEMLTSLNNATAALQENINKTDAANANTVWTCYEMHPLSWLLHVADEAATALDKI